MNGWTIIARSPETCALEVPGGCLVYIDPGWRGHDRGDPRGFPTLSMTFVPGVRIVEADGVSVRWKLASLTGAA